MGQGIDLARDGAPLHTALLDDFKEQLLLVLIQRLGGSVSLPVKEVDETGGLVLAMSVDADARVFHFEVRKKQ